MVQVSFLINEDLNKKIKHWMVEANRRNKGEAIIFLIERGLEKVQAQD